MRSNRDRARRAAVLAVVGLAAVLGLLLAVGVAVEVAPALSSGPYVPRPVDFELHDHGMKLERAATATASGRWHSAPRVLRAPKRFNLVGFRWRGPRDATLRVRVRREHGAWSRWVQLGSEPKDAPDAGSAEGRRDGHVASSDPLWAGQADELQYRLSAPAPVRDLTLHFVNSTGTATPLDRLRTGLRRAAHGVVAAVASLTGGRDAHADVLQPPIITRAQWGASSCPPRVTPAYGQVKLAFIHHTVTANDYGPGDSAAMVLAICRYHRNSNGWNDIGYQFLVDQYGQIFEGRAGGIDQAVVGAQAQGYNTQSTGIANLGTFSASGQTEAGLGALARLLSWKLALHGVDPHGTVVVRSGGGSLNRYRAGTNVKLNTISGHRDGDATSCPGDGLYAQLSRLRSMVAADPRLPSLISVGVERARIPYGRSARVEGTLAVADGSPLAGQPVEIQSIDLVGAHSLATVTTNAQGSFGLGLRLSFNRTVRAAFGGSAGVRPALSAPVRIGVRPHVTAALSPLSAGRLRVGTRVLVTGDVRPRKRLGLLLVDRRRADSSFGRIAKQTVKLRAGRARAVYRLSRPGSYRLRLGVDADRHNLGARSDPLLISAG